MWKVTVGNESGTAVILVPETSACDTEYAASVMARLRAWYMTGLWLKVFGIEKGDDKGDYNERESVEEVAAVGAGEAGCPR